MTRRLAWIAAGLAVLALAGLAGFAIAARIGPERVRAEIEARLVAEIGPVAVGAVRPFLAWGLGVEIADVQTPPMPDGTFLAADRVWITFSPRSLLRREPRARRIDVRGLRVVAGRDADGALHPPALARLAERVGAAPAGDGASLLAGGAALQRRVAAFPGLSVDRAAVRFAATGGPAPFEVVVRDLEAELSRHPLRAAPELRLAGRLVEGSSDSGGFALRGAFEEHGMRAELAVTDADLSAFQPWLAARGIRLALGGRASALARWEPSSGGGALALELLAFDLRVARRTGNDAVALALPSALLRARGEIRDGLLRATEVTWKAGRTEITGRASLERPVDDDAALAVELRGGPIEVAALRDLAISVTPEDRAPLRDNLGAFRGGTIGSFRLQADATPLRVWRVLPGDPLGSWPEGLELEMQVADLEIRSGEGDPIRDLDGSVALAHERISIRAAGARLGDGPLPSLALDVTGLRALAAALEAGAPPPPVPPMPGRIALMDWIDAQRRPGAPPRWSRLELDVDWIEHPALLRPLEEVHAVLTPADPGVHVEEAAGYWGGVRFEGTASLEGGETPSITAGVTLTPPRRAGHRRSDAEAWGRVVLHADLEKLGDFQAEWLDGVAQGIGDRIELRRGEAAVRPRGDLRGSVDLDLSRPDAVPYRAQLQLENGSLSELMNDLKLDGSAARGTADIDADLAGELRVGRPLLADLRGPVLLRLREGEIQQRMNILFAIAQVSDTLNPFRSRESIPYDHLDAPLEIGDGYARTDGFTLQGPALRMAGAGRVNLVQDPHEVEAAVGIFYFRTLDRVIGVVPLLNRLLLGPDDNLLSTYFAVTGPWAEPRARLIPIKSIASGPGSFALEGFPAFVRGSLGAIQRLLTVTEPRAQRAGGAPGAEAAPGGGAPLPSAAAGAP